MERLVGESTRLGGIGSDPVDSPRNKAHPVAVGCGQSERGPLKGAMGQDLSVARPYQDPSGAGERDADREVRCAGWAGACIESLRRAVRLDRKDLDRGFPGQRDLHAIALQAQGIGRIRWLGCQEKEEKECKHGLERLSWKRALPETKKPPAEREASINTSEPED